MFNLTVVGKGGHAAYPHVSIDPIYIGSLIVQALQGIVSRFTKATDPVVLTVTQFHAGTTHNVIPGTAFLQGTIRTTSDATHALVKKHFIDITSNIAAAYGATVEIGFDLHFPATVNHPAEADLVLQTATAVLGEQYSHRLTENVMGSEDFSYYLQAIPGAFFWVGIDPEGVEQQMLHHSKYIFNDEIIISAAQVMGMVAVNYLNQGF